MKLKLISLLIAVAVIFPKGILAESDQVCVTQYGGGTVCGVKTPEVHELKQAGIADLNLPLLGFGFVTVAGIFYWKSKKLAH